MNRADLLATVERLCDIDVDTLDRNELADVVSDGARLRGWLDALELRCTRHGRDLADSGRAEPATNLIAASSNRSSREAHQITRRGAVADAMPTFEDGLHNGSVSAGHLDAIANATRGATPEVRAAFAVHEHELIAHAANDTIETFTRRCRTLAAQLTSELSDNDAAELDRQRAASHIRRWVNPTDGMHHTDVALDPLRDEIVWNAINRAVRSMQQRDGNARTPWNQLQVDAFMATVLGGNGAAAPTSTPAQASAQSRASNRPTGHPAEPAPGRSIDQPSDQALGRTTEPLPKQPRDRPPSPAADIARDLAAAVQASMPDATTTATDPDPPGDARAHPNDTGGNDRDVCNACSDDPATEPALRSIDQRVTEISVLVDLTTLTGGLHDRSICETEDGIPLPVSTARRLCCDAEVIPVVLGGDGETLDVGRSRRTVNRAQRRALRAMHRTCAEPQCTVPYSHCKIHHIRWWWRDRGATDIDNLLPLCEQHHHLVHEGGWTLTMTPDRIATWTRPDGTVHHQGTTIDRQPTSRRTHQPPATQTNQARAG